MKSKIIWLQSAVNDLKRLRVFIKEKNPNAAARVAEAIILSVSKLEQFPLIGRQVEGLESYYDLFIDFGASGYNLRYRLYKEVIYIVHIKHFKELDFTG